MKNYISFIKPKRRILPFIPVRYVVATMLFFGMCCMYFIKLSLSVAVYGMVKSSYFLVSNTSQDGSDLWVDTSTCSGDRISDPYSGGPNGELQWGRNIMIFVFQSFNFGFIVSQLPGAMIGQRFGNVQIMGAGLLFAGIICIISPFAAKLHVTAFITVRIVQGICAGLFLSPMFSLIKMWFSVTEIQRISAIIFSALFMSNILSMGLTDFLSSVSWEEVFFVYGGIVIFFSLCFIVFTCNTPEDDPLISSAELDFIYTNSRTHRNDNMNAAPVPWLAILTCRFMWAATIMNAGVYYVIYTFMSELPKYARRVMHYDLEKVGLTAALPNAFGWLSCIICGFLSQYLMSINFFTRITTYKVFNGFATVGAALCLFLLEFAECDANMAMALYVVAIFTISAFYGGSSLNILDLSLHFTAPTVGISMIIVNLMESVPSFVRISFTEDNETLQSWHTVFYIAMGVIVFCYMLFVVFGSERPRLWDKQDEPILFENPQQDRNIDMENESDIKSKKKSLIQDAITVKESEVYDLEQDTFQSTGDIERQRKESLIQVIRKASRIEDVIARKGSVIQIERIKRRAEDNRKESVIHMSRQGSLIEEAVIRKSSVIHDSASRKNSTINDVIVIIENDKQNRKRKRSVYSYV